MNTIEQLQEECKQLKKEYEKLSKDWTAFRSIVVLQLDAIFNEIKTLESQGSSIDEGLMGMLTYLWNYVKENEPKGEAYGKSCVG